MKISFFFSLFFTFCFGCSNGLFAQDLEPKKDSRLDLSSEISVCAADYCLFLNEVAKTDFHHLYHEKLAQDPFNGSIVRSGTAGNYYYKVIDGRANTPITFINLADKSFYCRWLEQKQLAKEEPSTTSKRLLCFLDDNNDLLNPDVSYFLTDNNASPDVCLASCLSNFKIIFSSRPALALGSVSHSSSCFSKKGLFAAACIAAIFMLDPSDSLLERVHETQAQSTQGSSQISSDLSDRIDRSCDENNRSSSIIPMDEIRAVTSSPGVESLKSDTPVIPKGILKKGSLAGIEVAQTTRGGSPDSPTRFKSDAEEFFAASEQKMENVEPLEKDPKSKSVFFADSKKISSSSSSVFQAEQKEELPDLKGSKELIQQAKNYCKEFKNSIIDIELAIDALPEKTASNIATVYARAEPVIKRLNEKARVFSESHPDIKPQKLAELIAKASIEAIERDHYSQQFQKAINDITISRIPESDPERSAKIASICSEASANIKKGIEVFYTLASANPSLINKNITNLIATLLETLKEKANALSIEKNSSDTLVQQQSITAIKIIRNAIADLRKIPAILDAPAEEIGEKLLEHKKNRANNEYLITSQEYHSFSGKVSNHFWRRELFSDEHLTQFKKHMKLLAPMLNGKNNLCMSLNVLTPIHDAQEAKQSTVDYMKELVQTGVGAINDLIRLSIVE